MAEHLFAILVLEAYVLKGDIAMQRGPVLALGMEVIAVALRHLRAILNIRLGRQQREHAFRRRLRALKLREYARDIAHGLEELNRVVNEHL